MMLQENKHLALLTNILEELNKLENEEYQKEVINFLSPILYIKQKFKPVIGSYKKVKMNGMKLWSPEVELKLDYLSREVPPDIQLCVNMLIIKISFQRQKSE